MEPRIFHLVRVAGPPMKLGVAIVRLWIILLAAVLAMSGGTHMPHPQNKIALAGKYNPASMIKMQSQPSFEIYLISLMLPFLNLQFVCSRYFLQYDSRFVLGQNM